ncbi:hypothetical protein DOTSEDRAFT_25967 [Dothistroma septosporum NZE10]|uniref:Uncharacterized protein n=1 Tax=Dothistroma septosporum (strain NZE10 / CBS 128990) TaxID=675120 RepID=N1PLC5_DOTSN|nr:hypothetical protein DOTSEDRAFT_25967 [Dothistroma septosporum NZE10]
MVSSCNNDTTAKQKFTTNIAYSDKRQVPALLVNTLNSTHTIASGETSHPRASLLGTLAEIQNMIPMLASTRPTVKAGQIIQAYTYSTPRLASTCKETRAEATPLYLANRCITSPTSSNVSPGSKTSLSRNFAK